MPKNKSTPRIGEVNKAWFQAKISESGLTGRQVAKLMDMDPGQFWRMIAGDRRMQPQEAAMIADLIQAPLADVLWNAGVVVRSDGPLVRIVGTVGQDGSILAEVRGRRVVDRPPGLPETGEAIRIVGGWLDGAVGCYVPSRTVSIDAIGRLAVVEGKRAGKLFGVLQRMNGEAGRYAVLEYHSGRKLIENIILERAAAVLWLKCS